MTERSKHPLAGGEWRARVAAGDALGELALRGSVELASGQSYRTTRAGQRLRDGVEEQTDEWFCAPW